MRTCTHCGKLAARDQFICSSTQETVDDCIHCREEEHHGKDSRYGTVYRGSDGRFYGDVDIWDRLESSTWVPCCWDEQSGVEWVETMDEQLLALVPTAQQALPEETQVVNTGGGIRLHSE